MVRTDRAVTLRSMAEDKTSFSRKLAKKTLRGLKGRHKDEFGCLLCEKKPFHRNGYTKAKLLGLAQREEFGLHVLAIVRDGRGHELINASHGGTHEVSHLCRNPRCFNPRHLVVELASANKKRNFCIAWEHNGERYTNCQCAPRCHFREITAVYRL